MELLSPKVNKMLIVNVDSKRIGISFRHLAAKTIVRGEEIHTRMTHCGLWELPEDDTKEPIKISYGVAKCSEKDNFSKERGRKCSLTRALLQGVHEFSHLTPEAKEKRTLIWEAYRNRGESQNPSSNEGSPVVEGVVVDVQKLLPKPAIVH